MKVVATDADDWLRSSPVKRSRSWLECMSKSLNGEKGNGENPGSRLKG